VFVVYRVELEFPGVVVSEPVRPFLNVDQRCLHPSLGKGKCAGFPTEMEGVCEEAAADGFACRIVFDGSREGLLCISLEPWSCSSFLLVRGRLRILSRLRSSDSVTYWCERFVVLDSSFYDSFCRCFLLFFLFWVFWCCGFDFECVLWCHRKE